MILWASLAVLGGLALAVRLLRPVQTARAIESAAHNAEVEDEHDEATRDFRASSKSVVLLDNNLWNACTFDGISEDWGRHTSGEPRGFLGVPAGRHRVVTRTPWGDATLDFVLYPGETFARSLDPSGGQWLETHARANADADGLIAVGPAFGVARVLAGKEIVLPEEIVGAACARLIELVRGTETDAVATAREVGEGLIGVPLTRHQLRRLVAALEGADELWVDSVLPGVCERGRREPTP